MDLPVCVFARCLFEQFGILHKPWNFSCQAVTGLVFVAL